MPEVEYEVQVYEVDYFCDECKEPMKVRSIVAIGNETHYEHICPQGHEAVLPNRYPLVRHWRIDG